MLVTKNLAHTRLGDILVSTKVIDLPGSIPPQLAERLKSLHGCEDYLSQVGLLNIETMILTDKRYRFSNYQLRYDVHEEIVAVRRHQWIVWVICEVTGHPHPPRPSRFAYVSEDC